MFCIVFVDPAGDRSAAPPASPAHKPGVSLFFVHRFALVHWAPAQQPKWTARLSRLKFLQQRRGAVCHQQHFLRLRDRCGWFRAEFLLMRKQTTRVVVLRRAHISLDQCFDQVSYPEDWARDFATRAQGAAFGINWLDPRGRFNRNAVSGRANVGGAWVDLVVKVAPPQALNTRGEVGLSYKVAQRNGDLIFLEAAQDSSRQRRVSLRIRVMFLPLDGEHPSVLKGYRFFHCKITTQRPKRGRFKGAFHFRIQDSHDHHFVVTTGKCGGDMVKMIALTYALQDSHASVSLRR